MSMVKSEDDVASAKPPHIRKASPFHACWNMHGLCYVHALIVRVRMQLTCRILSNSLDKQNILAQWGLASECLTMVPTWGTLKPYSLDYYIGLIFFCWQLRALSWIWHAPQWGAPSTQQWSQWASSSQTSIYSVVSINSSNLQCLLHYDTAWKHNPLHTHVLRLLSSMHTAQPNST